ncbi:MAG: NAD(+)/NADH kinase, partial [Candidatus Altarchaeaceae archaeon]
MRKFSKFEGEISSIGIIVNPKILEKFQKIIYEILKYIENFKIIVEKDTADKLNFKNFEVRDINEIYADLVLTFGGDGTILHSLRELPNDPLILGINFGNLGFLTELNKRNAIEGIKKVINKDFYVERRTMLSVNKKYNALNELVISGQFPANLLDFVIKIGN